VACLLFITPDNWDFTLAENIFGVGMVALFQSNKKATGKR
jgi:hypothetical protein